MNRKSSTHLYNAYQSIAKAMLFTSDLGDLQKLQDILFAIHSVISEFEQATVNLTAEEKPDEK
jgi:hypothetical protein